MDIATVGLRVDGTGAVRGLDQFSRAADRATRSGTATEKMAGRLHNALVTLGFAFGATQIAEYADTWTLVGSRISLVTKSSQQLAAVQHELFRISNETRNSFDSSAALYQRLAINADELGISQRDMLNIVESVNNGLLTSGATAVEAAQSVRQLGQALGAGVLQGDEFRTVMEAMPAVAQAIARTMGVSTGELKKLSQEGKVTADVVIKALLDTQEANAEAAQRIPVTMGQAWTILRNHLTRFIGTASEASGAGQMVSRTILWMAQNLHTVAAAIGAAVTAWVAYIAVTRTAIALNAIITGAQTLQAFLQLARMVRSTADAMALLSMVSKGVVGAVAAIAAATVGFIAYRKALAEITKESEEWIAGLESLDDPIGNAGDRVRELTEEQERAIKKAREQRQANEDMMREATQMAALARLQGEAQERMRIEFEYTNDVIKAQREFTGQLLEETLRAIEVKRQMAHVALTSAAALEAEADEMERQKRALEEQKRQLENYQDDVRDSFADLFYDIFNEGISTFGDLFSGIRRLFMRLVAEMAAARLMRTVGASLAGAMAGMAGVASGATAQTVENVAVPGPGGAMPVMIEGITVTGRRSVLATILPILTTALASFGVGQMVGGLTTNRAAGAALGAGAGAAAGAAIGTFILPGVGTAAGAAVGALAGLVGGLFGASKAAKKAAEEMKRLEDGRLAFEQMLRLRTMEARGMRYEAELYALEIKQANELKEAREEGIATQGQLIRLERLHAEERARFLREQQQAREEERQAMRDAYYELFDVPRTPTNQLAEQYDHLMRMVPELMQQMGLANLNMNSPEARNVLLHGLQEIFRLLESGMLTDQLLGSFTEPGQLLDAILATKDGLDAFRHSLNEAATDIPKAINLALYQQMHATALGGGGSGDPYRPTTPGAIGPGMPPPTNPIHTRPVERPVVHIGTVVNEAGDDPERLATKMEQAATYVYSRGRVLYLPGAVTEP